MICNLCPRQCNADRIHSQGFCLTGWEPEVAVVCAHHGEEPPLCGEKGICNVFFSHCNLGCTYCQNWQITQGEQHPRRRGVEAIVDNIAEVLSGTENIVGFVTPTHYANSIPAIVEGLHHRGLHPTTVYNTGGYERVATLQMIAPYIDIYLPDYKYADSMIAQRYSHAADYPEAALGALKEMYRQKGSGLRTDERGMAFGGIIVRHLVLPGCVESSRRVLDNVASVSQNLYVSLMAQYYPPERTFAMPDELGRTLREEEYAKVVEHFHTIGLHNGFIQALDAQQSYRPDFTNDSPFNQ